MTGWLTDGKGRRPTPQSKLTEQVQFFKDMAPAGASPMLIALIAHAGSDLGLTITGPLFNF